jgi:hypothetical protein
MRFMAMGVASGATEATGGGDDLHGLGDAVAAAIGPTDGGKDAPLRPGLSVSRTFPTRAYCDGPRRVAPPRRRPLCCELKGNRSGLCLEWLSVGILVLSCGRGSRDGERPVCTRKRSFSLCLY